MKVRNKKWTPVVVLLLMLSMVMTACGSGNAQASGTSAQSTESKSSQTTTGGNDGGKSSESESGENVKYRDTLNVAIAQEAASYDLHKVSSRANKHVTLGSVFEKLVTLNGKSEVVPELAESYDISDDGKTFTFHLRKGVKFHDGSEMTADDVVASMNRWIEAFSSAKTLAGDARFEKVDEYTVTITLPNSARTFVDVIAGSGQPAAITTAAACADEDENGFLKEYIGTGPYKFVEWKLNQYILLQKFEDYVPYGNPDEPIDGWAGYKNAYIDNIYFWYVLDSTTRIAGLESGQYDIIYGATDDAIARLSGNDEIAFEYESEGTSTIVFNKKEGIASDKYLRQAINTAIDYDDLMVALYGSLYEADSSYMDASQATWHSTAGSEYYNQKDLEKAKELLAKSSYNGETFRLLISTGDASEKHALVFQEQLSELGIPVEILSYDSATFSQYRNDPSLYDAYVTSWIPHPIPPLKPYFGATFAGWADDEKLQNYFTEFYAADTIEKAQAIWDEAQEYCWSDYVPVIVTGHTISAYAYNKKLSGFDAYVGLWYWNARIEE